MVQYVYQLSITGDGDVEKKSYVVRVCVAKEIAAFWNCVFRMVPFGKRGISGTMNH